MTDFSKANELNGKSNLPARRNPSRYEQSLDAASRRDDVADAERKIAPPQPFEPRCDCCKSPYRQFIDTLLIKGGHSYVEIAKKVPGPPLEGGGYKALDRRSVSNHAKHHLGFADAAMRAILEDEAERAGKNYEEAVTGAITHRGTLEVALRKAHEDIINGTTTVEPRDLIKIVELSQKMDDQTAQVQVDEYRAQLNAFIRAIQRNVPREKWEKIAADAKSIYAGEDMSDPGALPEGEIIDATAIE